MMQVLDRFRNEFEKETGQKYSWVVECRDDTNRKQRYETMPSWDYVCWLESRLAGWEGVLKKTEYTLTTANSEVDIIDLTRLNKK